MGLLSWIKKFRLPDSETNKTQEEIKKEEHTEEQKFVIIDNQVMEKELVKLKNRKFRVERIEYKRSRGLENLVVFYAQIKLKCKHNDSEWQYIYGRRNYDKNGIFENWLIVDWTFTVNKTPFPTEEEALEFIEEYKRYQEREIRRKPKKEAQMREYKKYEKEREIELKAKRLANEPKVTYKNID